MHFHQAFNATGVWTLKPDPGPETNLPEDFESDSDPALPPIHRYIEAEMIISKRCLYCHSALEVFEYSEEDYPIDGFAPDYARLAYCEYCAYWNWYSGMSYRADLQQHAAMSVLKEFASSLPVGLTQELARHLRQNQRLWHRLNPKAMERIVADIFRANFRDSEVLHVGKPGDGGTDVIFVDADSHQWLIQVKSRQSPDSVESFETVQRLLGTMLLSQSRYGVVASNADHFSSAALRAAGSARNLGYAVELLDRGRLTRMLGPSLPLRPWEPYLNTFSDFPQEFRELLYKQRIRTEQLWLF